MESYAQTIEFLFNQLPMFQHNGEAAYRKDVHNTVAICKILGNPEKKFKSVHVAGTNGKGSTAHILSSVFQEAGYKVGLYTSPHLKDFRERVKINGKMIPENKVITFVQEYFNSFIDLSPSFFEWTVGLAFHYFAEEQVDIAIIEVGMGGRLDSTNVITPELSVITNISFDHQQFLGNTLELIAKEKAGIIKAGKPVVIGETQSETAAIFDEKAACLGCEIIFADQDFYAPSYQTDLKGIYQEKNKRTALCAIDVLYKAGWKIDEFAVINGLKNVITNTGLQGRWQVLENDPFVICDTGHNLAGIIEVLRQLEHYRYNILHLVLGTVKDKDIDYILKLLPKDACYYFCNAQIPRALKADELQRQAMREGLFGESFPSVESALAAAKRNARKEDLVFVGGSTFVVAEVV